jgi:hypothetical protein
MGCSRQGAGEPLLEVAACANLPQWLPVQKVSATLQPPKRLPFRVQGGVCRKGFWLKSVRFRPILLKNSFSTDREKISAVIGCDARFKLRGDTWKTRCRDVKPPERSKARAWSKSRLIAYPTEICRSRDFEFFNRIGQNRTLARGHIDRIALRVRAPLSSPIEANLGTPA